MKNLRIILLLLVSSASFAQSFEMYKGDTVNRKDAQDQRQGHWVVLNKANSNPGYVEGQLVEEGEYFNNKKVGVWKKFYPNSKLKGEITFANNQPNGPAKFYYDNGRLQEEGNWKDRKWVGNYKYYHENGVLFYDWQFNSDGKREGPQKYYYANGNPMYEGDWRDGKESGILKEYYENGSMKAEKYFNDGKIDPGNTKNYDLGNPVDRPKAPVGPMLVEAKKEEPPKELGAIPDGQFTTYHKGDKNKIEKEGTFKNKVLVEGKHNVYDATGKLLKTLYIKGGKVVETKLAGAGGTK
jgi:antitoxin component YwqK of YwqJK toxin-antitoxin module